MKEMVLNGKTIDSEERFQFRWNNNTKGIVTVNIGKSIRSTISEKKREVVGYNTLPFGYRTIGWKWFFEHSEHIEGTFTFIVFEQQPILQLMLSNIVIIPFINFLIRAIIL